MSSFTTREDHKVVAQASGMNISKMECHGTERCMKNITDGTQPSGCRSPDKTKSTNFRKKKMYYPEETKYFEQVNCCYDTTFFKVLFMTRRAGRPIQKRKGYLNKYTHVVIILIIDNNSRETWYNLQPNVGCTTSDRLTQGNTHNPW